jgi:hypothetical protein
MNFTKSRRKGLLLKWKLKNSQEKGSNPLANKLNDSSPISFLRMTSRAGKKKKL